MENNKYFITGIVNEDGTEMDDYPENPLKEKWDKLYPPTQRYDSGVNCEGYSCMWCSKCPHGSYWKVPEEDREVYNEHLKQCYEYHKIHNPSMYQRIKEYYESL